MIEVSNIRLLDGTPVEITTDEEFWDAMFRADVVATLKWVPNTLSDPFNEPLTPENFESAGPAGE